MFERGRRQLCSGMGRKLPGAGAVCATFAASCPGRKFTWNACRCLRAAWSRCPITSVCCVSSACSSDTPTAAAETPSTTARTAPTITATPSAACCGLEYPSQLSRRAHPRVSLKVGDPNSEAARATRDRAYRHESLPRASLRSAVDNAGRSNADEPVAPIAFCACPTASSRSCARLRCRCRHLHAVATSKPSRPSWRRPSASMMRPSKPWSRHGPAHDREMLADHQSRPALLESPTARSKSSPRSTASDHDGAVSSPKVLLGKHRRDINFDCHVGPRQLADHQEC